MYSNCEVYLCKAILVMEIFCYRYSAVHNSAQKQYFKRNLVIFSATYWELSVSFAVAYASFGRVELRSDILK